MAFSPVYPGAYAFVKERKSLVNLEVFLGENRPDFSKRDKRTATSNMQSKYGASP